jgi:hypothetical protein
MTIVSQRAETIPGRKAHLPKFRMRQGRTIERSGIAFTYWDMSILGPDGTYGPWLEIGWTPMGGHVWKQKELEG